MTVLLLGGGDLASGVALRLFHAGIRIVITELPQPLAVRRLVSFSEAVYSGETTVEGITATRVEDPSGIFKIVEAGRIPVLVDPDAEIVAVLQPVVLVDARMTKRTALLKRDAAPLVVGLGPGFIAGDNCHAVVETQRGHMLGRVLWSGSAEPNTGQPDAVLQYRQERILRAPANGIFLGHAQIGDRVSPGQVLATVAEQNVVAPFPGVLRGLLASGVQVQQGLKVGDVDPRGDPRYARLVSDKSLAIGGGVLEAILTRSEIRQQLWLR